MNTKNSHTFYVFLFSLKIYSQICLNLSQLSVTFLHFQQIFVFFSKAIQIISFTYSQNSIRDKTLKKRYENKSIILRFQFNIEILNYLRKSFEIFVKIKSIYLSILELNVCMLKLLFDRLGSETKIKLLLN